MRNLKIVLKYIYFLLLTTAGLSLSAKAQTIYATAAQKAKAIYITSENLSASEDRREDNDNSSATILIAPDDMKYTIDGPKNADRNSKQTYTLIPRAPVGYWWYVSYGTVLGNYDDMISIQFNTSATYVDIMLFNQSDVQQAKFRVNISGDPTPISGGSILTGSQSVNANQVAGNIFASPASGGDCGGNFMYQWQYSFDEINFRVIEDAVNGDSLEVESNISQNTYFRRRVICDADTLYTGSVAIFLVPELLPGKISTTGQIIDINTLPPTISATSGMIPGCTTGLQYQWQQSADGYSFVNIDGANSLSLSYPVPLTGDIYFRRRISCGTVIGYTVIIQIKVKQSVIAQPVVKNSIDSLLEHSGINIAQLFNLYNDSVSNVRPFNRTLDSLETDYALQQKTFAINNPYGVPEQADIQMLLNDTLKDNIEARINPTNPDFNLYRTLDSSKIPILFLSDTLIDQYVTAGNFNGLDSLFSLYPKIPIEEILQQIEQDHNASIPEGQRTYEPIINPLALFNSAVIYGPVIVHQNELLHYTASFYFPLGNSPSIQWLINGGTIVSQNVNPTNGQIFVNVLWQNPNTVSPYVSIVDFNSNQYQVLPVYFHALGCNNIYPVTQTLLYGQIPNFLMIGEGCTPSNGYTAQYQWQQLDVYGSGIWTNISGATSVTYQPPALIRPAIVYKRTTYFYSPSGVLNKTISSSGSQVKLYELNAGGYQNATGSVVPFNTVPVITQIIPAYGGMLVPPGGTYSYTWEASVNNGSWTQIGTGANFPNYPITQNQKIRWVVTITGVPPSVYSLPQQFWKAYSVDIILTTTYQTQDYENRNYIRQTAVLTRGLSLWENVDALPMDKKMQTTTYLDGLSRPIQVVSKGTHYDDQTNQWYDMVQNITYEAGGRIDKSLLPYPSTENIGKFKNNSSIEQPNYYATKFNDNNAFSKVEYDNSPLNKVVKSSAPGDAWVGNNVSVSGDVEPYSGAEEVHWFTVGYTEGELPQNKGIYPSLFLLKTFSKDEKDKKVVTYTNRSGQVVLKKVQLNNDATLSNQHYGWLCTYYVYDDLGQLRFIITPKAVPMVEDNNWEISNSLRDELCFWYDYDELGRAIAKKTPGKSTEYTVYDKRNRPVFVQDGNLNADANSYIATTYDELNRPVMTGLYKASAKSLSEIRQQANNVSSGNITVNTTNGGTVTLWGSAISASEINDVAVFTQLSFNYYDNYNYNGSKTFDATHTTNLAYKNITANGNIESATITQRISGMPTGSRIKVLNGNNTSPTYLSRSVFFDEEGRAIQGQEDNIKGGIEISSTEYHFDGRVLSTSETHNGNGTVFTNFNILTKYKFDKIGRVVGIGKKINDATRSYGNSINVITAQEDADAGYKITAAYKYNELSRRYRKILSPNYNSGQGLETIDYSYNIRGWLTGINKDYALGEYNNNQWEHYFGMYIGYNSTDQFANGQLNGQISGVQWKSQGDNTPRKFEYQYDNANRLAYASFKQRGNNTESWNNTKVDFSTKDIFYDENGNLLTMTQMGIIPGATAPVMVDKLSYWYNEGNKLMRVIDQGNAGSVNGKLGDFIDGSNDGTDDYSYDANGNIVLDQNRRISNIQYNYLDKPELITVAAPSGGAGGGTIKYIYDAGGSKMQKVVKENPTPTNGNQQKTITTTYINEYIYQAVTIGVISQAEELTIINHEEGRIRIITPYVNASDPNNIISGGVALPGGKQGIFDYFIKDNLSNVRATITEEINKASSSCSMEDANPAVQQYEENLFGNPGAGNEVASTRDARPSAWTSGTPPGTPLSQNQKVSKLIATGGQAKVGPNVILKVMAGDKISAYADYYYEKDPGPNTTSLGAAGLIYSFLNALGSGRTSAITHGQNTQIGNNLNNNSTLNEFFITPPPGSSLNANAPRAYLNYIFFDEQFNFVKELSGFKRVSQAGDGTNPMVLSPTKATKNGYVYVYLSNESGEPVYFDNFAVTHERGQLIGEDHYYAYGLKIASISSKSVSSSLNPKMISHGYQGSFSEEIEDFDLNYNEFELRNYDPQIGRWTGIDPYNEFASPYVGMGSNPINLIDRNGGTVISSITGTTNIVINTAATTIVGSIIGGIVGMITGKENAWKVGGIIGFGVGVFGSISLNSTVSPETSALAQINAYFSIAANEIIHETEFFPGPNVGSLLVENLQNTDVGKVIIDPEVSADPNFSKAIQYIQKIDIIKNFFDMITSGALGKTDLVFNILSNKPNSFGFSEIRAQNMSEEGKDEEGKATYDFEPYIDITSEQDINTSTHLQIKISLNLTISGRNLSVDIETVIHELIVHAFRWVKHVHNLRTRTDLNNVKKEWANATVDIKGGKHGKDGDTRNHQDFLMKTPQKKSAIRALFDKAIKAVRKFLTPQQNKQLDKAILDDEAGTKQSIQKSL